MLFFSSTITQFFFLRIDYPVFYGNVSLEIIIMGTLNKSELLYFL